MYVALGACLSALTENQVVAFVLGVVASAILCFAGFPQVIEWINRNVWGLGKFLGYFGTFFHFDNFAKGQVGLVGVIYCLTMMGLFLGLNTFAVERRKY